MSSKREKSESFRRIEVRREGVELTRLQFADDTLIFVPQNFENFLNLKRLLDCFSVMTGLEVNYEKSSLVSWNSKCPWVEEMAGIIGCKVEKLSITYLGLPLGVSGKNSKC